MIQTKRRQLMGMLGASALGAVLPHQALAATISKVPTNTGASGRVVVIGGGMAGATVAKYLRLWGGSKVSVTLVERDARYTSNIMSNLVLSGAYSLSNLYFTYDKLKSNYGVQVTNGEVKAIDPVGKKVTLASGTVLPYDRLVIAPGIDFDVIPGLENAGNTIVHAWKAGAQTTTLQSQIAAMKAGGVFVMSIPAAPYRCPPGPYERACVVADYLKRRKPGSKVIVLDANADIIAEKANFSNAFNVIHKGVIEYRPATTVLSIDPATKTFKTNLGDIKGDVINPIPSQRAGQIIASSGLANVNQRWAGVDVLSYESTAIKGIHVIGDASATTQPKAGHIANQEAKVCADAISRILAGGSPDPAPMTNSACFSPITATTASWLTAIFAYDQGTAAMKVVPGASGEAPGPSKDNYEDMFVWYKNLMADSFA